MDHTLTPDQRDLQRGLRQFLGEQWPEEAVRASMEGPNDRETRTWQRLAGDLGAVALVVPEEYDGLGLGQPELALAAEEMGRVLYGGPWFATVALAVNALLVSGDETACKEYLPVLASGGTTATVALENAGRRGAAAEPVRATSGPDGWRLDGAKTHVVDGEAAELVLVTAATDEGKGLFVVEDAAAVRRTSQEPLDPTRRLASLTFEATPARRVAVGPGWADALQDRVALAVAAEAVGGAAACVDATVRYVKEREQFGRAIGSFQAVKHRLADMRLRVDAARSAVRSVAASVEAGDDRTPVLVSVAKAYATEGYFRTAADMIQLHGGIGFTWEHGSHLHFKRAKALELAFGSPREHRARIADSILAGAS